MLSFGDVSVHTLKATSFKELDESCTVKYCQFINSLAHRLENIPHVKLDKNLLSEGAGDGMGEESGQASAAGVWHGKCIVGP